MTDSTTITTTCCLCRKAMAVSRPPASYTGPDANGVFWQGNVWLRFTCGDCSKRPDSWVPLPDPLHPDEMARMARIRDRLPPEGGPPGPRVMEGVREYFGGDPVTLDFRTCNDGRPVIVAYSVATDCQIDLLDLIAWLRQHRPDLLTTGEAG